MKIVKIRNVNTPIRSHKTDAGIDFFIPNDFEKTNILPQQSILIKSGIHVRVPKGYSLIALNKSGVCSKKGLIVGSQVIDEGYEGEIHIHLINTTKNPVLIFPGEKIIQFILIPMFYDDIVCVKSLNELYDEKSERGITSFGSTNEK